MAKFVQIIEFTSTRQAEIDALQEEWLRATEGKRTTGRALTTTDRDRPNTYVAIVEFDSYEGAMRNNDLPETQRFAEQMTKLCDGPPVFRNLDVMREDV
jgi:quinol monooxygenase YgiN